MIDALLPLLPSLVALVEENSVGRAAKRLGVSQPRMSARLATLRMILDDPVLVSASGSRGLIATDRARNAAGAARRTLADLNAAIKISAFDAGSATRTFSIMANDNAAAIVVLPLIERIRARSGANVRIALHHFDTSRLSELENGRIDLALGAPTQFEQMPALIARTIVRDRFVSAVRPGGFAPSDLESYCRANHVLVSSEGGGFEGLVDRALAANGRSRRVVLSVQNYLLAIKAIASSDMVATLPLALLNARDCKLDIFETPIPLQTFTLTAVWHAKVDTDPAHRWLRENLYDCVVP